MPKTDYYDDPAAPKPNSIVPAVAAIARNGNGAILLIKRSDNGLWALPGGAQDIGESLVEAVQREVQEETGLEVRVTGLSGIYSDPRHVIAYDNGEVRQEFSVCFHVDVVGGTLKTSAESNEVRWIQRESLEKLPIHPSMRLRIDHGLVSQARPYIN